ncbi:MAG: WD40 repeat domain-containing protein [Pseudanabaenaceae cyanobacterium]|jgi:WD40 repeat protein/tetratricopeptide (TPR) repeat protein
MTKNTLRKSYISGNGIQQELLLNSIQIALQDPKGVRRKSLEICYQFLTNLDFIDIKCNHSKYGIQELVDDYTQLIEYVQQLSDWNGERTEVLQIIHQAIMISPSRHVELDLEHLVGQLLKRFPTNSYIKEIIQEIIFRYEQTINYIENSQRWNNSYTDILNIIRDTLTLSINILEQHPNQLVAQLLGRLMYFTQPEIVRLVQQVENHPAPYLVPRNSVLPPPTQKLVRTLQGHEDSKVTALITVPLTQEFEQSFLIISGGEDQQIKIWDGLSGNLYQILEKHKDSITALASTPDGKYIFSGSADGAVIIWQVNLIDEQKIEIKPLHSEVLSHDDLVKALAISADQRLFVASGQKIYIYEWQSNNLVVTLKGHTGAVNCLLCDRANQNLYSGSDDGLIYIWDMQNYQHIGTLKPKAQSRESYRQRMAGKLNSVLSMCFIEHTKVAAIFRDGLLHEFDIDKRQETRNSPLPNTISYADFYDVSNGYIYSFSKYDLIDNDLAIAAGNSFAIGESKEIFRSNKSNIYNLVHNNLVSAFCISPDSKYAISGEEEIKIWRVSTAIENEIVVTPAHNKPITHIQIVSDKNICISASNRLLRAWNLSTLAEVWDMQSYEVRDILLPEGDKDYAVVVSENTFEGLYTDSGEPIFFRKLESCNLLSMFLTDGIDDSIVAFANKETFTCIQLRNKTLVRVLEQNHTSEISCLAVTILLFAYGAYGVIQITDVLYNTGLIYLPKRIKPKSIIFVYQFRLLVWCSDDSITVYDGLINTNEEELEDKIIGNIHSIFKTNGQGYQISSNQQYIVPISTDKKTAAIYCPNKNDSQQSHINIINLQNCELLYHIPVDFPNLVSWQFDIDFDDSERYLIGVYDPSSKPESAPIAKNLIVWDLKAKKKCCEFVNDLEITSYKMSSKLESVIVGDAGGRLHFLQFKSENTESINLYLNSVLNPEYLVALKNMIDLDSYEAPRFMEKYYDIDKIYVESWSNFFKSIFYLVRFNYPKFIEHIKQFWSGMDSASSIEERFEKENLKNAEIVISYDPNNYEAYWIKGKIYLKQAKSFFDKKLYKQGMQAAHTARKILDKADTLSENSSKVNDAIYSDAREAQELDYKCFFWQPVTKMSELFDEPLETESDFRSALKIVNSMINNIAGSSRYANIPNLLAKAYIYKAKLNLMLGNDTEALEICNLALKIKPINDDTQVIYGIMADAYDMQNKHKLARKYRRQSKSIGGSNSGRVLWESLWAWGEQFENNPNLDDRVKFFLVKIVTPIRVFSFYFTAWAILMYFLYPVLFPIVNDLYIISREYISHILDALNKK